MKLLSSQRIAQNKSFPASSSGPELSIVEDKSALVKNFISESVIFLLFAMQLVQFF